MSRRNRLAAKSARRSERARKRAELSCGSEPFCVWSQCAHCDRNLVVYLPARICEECLLAQPGVRETVARWQNWPLVAR